MLIVLTSRAVCEDLSSILESLRNSDLEGARRKLDVLEPEVKTERERGSLLAATGIYASSSRGKERTLLSWGRDRIARAAKSIESSQMADDFDRGYAETLLKYANLMLEIA